MIIAADSAASPGKHHDMKLHNRILFPTTFLVVLLLTAMVTLQWIDDRQIAETFTLLIHPWLLGIAVPLVMAQTLTDGLTAHTSLSSATSRPIPVMPVIAITWLANTIGITIPGPAKTPLRAVLQKRLLHLPYRVSVVGLVIETLISYLILIPTAAITSWVWLRQDISKAWQAPLWFWYLLIAGLCAILALVVFKVARRLESAERQSAEPGPANQLFRPRWQPLTHTTLLTMLIYLFGIFRLMVVASIWGVDLPLGTLSAVFLLSRLSGTLSMLPMGIGARDASLAGLLVLIGVPLEASLAITALERVLLTLPYLATGPLAAHYLHRHSPNIKSNQLHP